MDKEIIIKKVGGGWLVTIWKPPKKGDLGQVKQEEQVFTDKDELLDFVSGQV